MNRVIRTICLVLLGCGTSLAHAAPDRPECPTITVNGPAGIVAPGGTATFVVEVKGKVPDVLKYNWQVSSGKIIKGNATKTIQVVIERDTTTATVEIGGLPEGCARTASETMIICIPPVPVLLDEFSLPVAKSIDRLMAAAEILKENPNDMLYIIEYFPKRTSATAIRNKLKAMREVLVGRGGSDPVRVTYVTDFAAKPLTRIYWVPPGADIPVP